MPRIPDWLAESVVYLYRSEDDALAGRASGGSGFLVVARRDGAAVGYVVTNFHVVREGALTVRVNDAEGGVHTTTIPGPEWTRHPDGDDIAVAELDPDGDPSLAIRPLEIEDIAGSFDDLADLNPGVGDEVVMLGRFAGHSGLTQNEPVARFGNVARMAGGERIRDGRGELVDAFLVDMRSQAGYSGSPVLIVLEAGRGDGRLMTGGPDLGFLGIDTGHKLIDVPVWDKRTDAGDEHYYVQTNSGIAVVAPYYKIAELLNTSELVERREQLFAQWAAQAEPAQAEAGGDRGP